MCECIDNQEVGLEAATLERVRNSSLVEWSCADNVTGLKSCTEAADFHASGSGRGALPVQRSQSVRTVGALGSENAGMSNERGVMKPLRRTPKGS